MTQAPIPHKMLSKHNLKAMPDLYEQGGTEMLSRIFLEINVHNFESNFVACARGKMQIFL